jgi:outer membrane protein TolC
MKRLTLLLLIISGVTCGQNNTLSLDSCLQMAKRNYPLIKQNDLIAANERNNRNNDNKLWLPKLSFISKATYQSEVLEFPGFNLPHENYLTAVDLEQNIFDGGQIHRQKELDKLNSENELQKNQVELYKIVDRITQLYSNILLTRENVKALTIYKTDVVNKKVIIAASYTNGLALESSVNELEAEQLKTEQSLIESQETVTALYKALQLFINKAVDDSTVFLSDPVQGSKGDAITRPEIKAFETQSAVLDARHKLTNSSSLPRLTIGGEYAYGYPGPNFANPNMHFFGQANVALKWNISSLYSLNNEKQNLAINKQMIDVQREVFEFNLKNTMLNQAAQINSLNAIIEKDKAIVQKRHNIRLTASKQFENGSITSTDYLIQLNAEMQAMLNQKVHEVKLMNAITNYNSSKGIYNF